MHLRVGLSLKLGSWDEEIQLVTRQLNLTSRNTMRITQLFSPHIFFQSINRTPCLLAWNQYPLDAINPKSHLNLYNKDNIRTEWYKAQYLLMSRSNPDESLYSDHLRASAWATRLSSKSLWSSLLLSWKLSLALYLISTLTSSPPPQPTPMSFKLELEVQPSPL